MEGRVVIVTGNRKGIGKYIALAFAEVGAGVIVCDVMEHDGLKLVVHPEAFKKHRFFIVGNGKKIDLPNLERSLVENAGFSLLKLRAHILY
jgi:NAD(P)-dependent dehydrogenase (short-subunit alcohol dehydrogenase family)